MFLLLSAVTTCAEAPSREQRLVQAYASAHDLDHDGALRRLRALGKLVPDLPATYRATASIAWLRLLFTRGTVLADEYLGRITRHDVDLARPPADVEADVPG